MARDVATQDDKSTDVEAYDGDDVEGLEDAGAGDVLLPIIKIDHKRGGFVDSLSNEFFEEFDGIMLGLVKGRILWPSKVGSEGEQPVCRSIDFQFGRPDPVKFVTRDVSGQYPSKVSKFGRDRITRTIEALEEDPATSDTSLLLPCAECQLKEWDTMPGNTTPWCSEQYTFPVIRLDEEGGQHPGYITFQRAGLKACRAYISVFKGSKKPMYTTLTHIRAVHQRRGDVEYVTPEFTKLTGTDPERWPEFSLALRDIRNFLTTPRARREDSEIIDHDDDDDDDDDETPAPAAKRGKGEVIDTTATDSDDDASTGDTPDDDDETPPPSAKANKAKADKAKSAPAVPYNDDEEPF